MINIKQFLKDNIPQSNFGCYTLITLNNNTEAFWFSKYDNFLDNTPFFLESYCQLIEICNVDKPIEEFCLEIAESYELEDDVDTSVFLKKLEEDFVSSILPVEDEKLNKYKNNVTHEFIEKYIKPMIRNNKYYEILNLQHSPCLPEEVEHIKIISETECFDFLLKQNNVSE